MTPVKLNGLLGQLGQRRRDGAEVFDEPTVIASRTEERTHVSSLGWCGPLLDGLHLALHHSDTVTTDDVTKELDLSLEQLTLGLLGVKLLATEDVEYDTNVLLVPLGGLGVDEDVVKEDDDEVIQLLAEGLVHQTHESCWCIRETEGQNEELEVTIPRTKGGLGNIGRIDANLVIPTTKIDLTEVLRTLQPIEEFVHTRKSILVLDGDLVQCTVVDAHSHGAVLLLHE